MTDQTQAIPTGLRPPADRRHRKVAAVVVAIILVLLLLVATASSDDPTGASSTPSAGGSSSSDDATEDALDADDDSAGYPDSGENVAEPPVGGGDFDPVELDPVGTVDQCADVLATGASLLVTPDPAVLEAGDMSSSLTIRNCGEADVDWTAKTVPSVALDTAGSTLASDATTQLGFTIDSEAYEPGAVDFKIKVLEPGHNHYVDVHAFRKTVGKDLVAGGNAFAGPVGSGGCANSCITKAWLTPNASTPNLGFEVKTDTPAKIRVWVGTQPQNGGGQPMAVSPNGSTAWTTVLKPLQPSTKYYLLLRATDANGKVDERSTSFTTITPANSQTDLASVDPKCLAQCISKAMLNPGSDFSNVHLTVESKAKARFQARVSTKAPTYSGGVPSFAAADVVALSGLEYREHWSTDLQPLEGDTKYHIIVQAEDVDGHTAYQVGDFRTAPEPTSDVLITFHKVTVTHDGDSSWKNRGELSFAWAVGDTTIGTRGEAKMSNGDSFSFPRPKSTYLATGLHADDFLPNVRVSGSERDADGRVEFCAMGTGAAMDWGHNDDCDAKWNVASSGLVSVDSIASMTRCSELGIDEPTGQDGCVVLETVDHGSDYARFRVVVSFHIAS